MTWARPSLPDRAARERSRTARMGAMAEQVRATLRQSAVCGGTTSGPAPKGPKAKPGKGAPNKAEREWMDAIVRYGCVACRMDGLGFRPAAVHHILRGGRRLGHLFTLPLCDPGHHQGRGRDFPSRHPWKAAFEAKYGTEAELLARLRAELGK